MKLNWTEDLRVGNVEIDGQHKELFRRLNELVDAIEAGKGSFEVGATIKFLEDYVILHFCSEERVMLSLRYPKLQLHKIQHEEFKKKILALKRLFSAKGGTMEVLSGIHEELCKWLTTHIPNDDKELAAYVKTDGRSVGIKNAV